MRRKVLEYAMYTFIYHSSENEDLKRLNEIFETDITMEEVYEALRKMEERKQ